MINAWNDQKTEKLRSVKLAASRSSLKLKKQNFKSVFASLDLG